MEKNKNFETLYKPVIVLTLIALICSALLAVTNNVTAPIIVENDKAATLKAYMEVLKDVPSTDALETLEGYPEGDVLDVVKTADGQIAVKSTAVGYDGGKITVIMGFDADGNILGVHSDSSTQTAGMGSKCDTVMTPQLSNTGKTADHEMVLNTDVDQVGGCTVSSAAYIKAVNAAINCFNEVKEAA